MRPGRIQIPGKMDPGLIPVSDGADPDPWSGQGTKKQKFRKSVDRSFN